jgi:hypothetical protein
METLEEIVSEDGRWKAAITPRKEGLFEVRLFRWMGPPLVGFDAGPWWSGIGNYLSLTDSLDNARQIGHELLKEHVGQL